MFSRLETLVVSPCRLMSKLVEKLSEQAFSEYNLDKKSHSEHIYAAKNLSSMVIPIIEDRQITGWGCSG